MTAPDEAAAALAAAGLPVEWAPHVRSAGKVRILLEVPNPPNPNGLCLCGHLWLHHDVDEYRGDGTETCCVEGCGQTGCPGRTPVTGQYGSPKSPGRDTTEPDTAAVPGTDHAQDPAGP